MLFNAGDSHHTKNIQINIECHLHQLVILMFAFQSKIKNLLDHISTYENTPFLKRFVTDDEKWMLYSNVEQKRLWSKWNKPPPTTPKASLQPKSMLCIWCPESVNREYIVFHQNNTVQFSSVAQLCLTLCYPMNHSTPGLPVHHQHPEFTQTHIHRVGDAIQPSHPLLSPAPLVPNPSPHQGLFQWVSSSHEVAKVLKFQFQHQSFQWTPRTDLL